MKKEMLIGIKYIYVWEKNLEIYKLWLSLDYLLWFFNWLILYVIYIRIKFLIENNIFENIGYFYLEFFFFFKLKK